MQIPCQGYCPKFDSTMSWPLAKLLASTPKETIAPKQTKGGRRRSRKQSLTRSSAIILLTMKVRSGFLGGTYHHHVGQDEYRDDDYFAVEQTCNPIKIGFTFNCSHFNPSAFDPRPQGISTASLLHPPMTDSVEDYGHCRSPFLIHSTLFTHGRTRLLV